MSLHYLASVCNPKSFDYGRCTALQDVTEGHTVLKIAVDRKDTDSIQPTTQVEYEIQPWHAPIDSKLAQELSNAVTHARASSLEHAPKGISARPFPRPHRSGSPILDLGEAQHEQASGVTQAANRRSRRPGELSTEAQELRRPPSPFLLLDADHTRPELPTNARILHAISVSRID